MSRRAFTLVELLVVIAIIGLLSTVAVVATSSARVNARNAQRKANLLQVSKALELYFSNNNSYPTTGGSANWQGTCSDYGSYPDSGAGAWIPGFQSYVAVLPHDPNTGIPNPTTGLAGCRTSGVKVCYLYTSNGTDYKLIAHCTPEGTMSASDSFYDPNRPNWAWQVTNNPSVTSGW